MPVVQACTWRSLDGNGHLHMALFYLCAIRSQDRNTAWMMKGISHICINNSLASIMRKLSNKSNLLSNLASPFWTIAVSRRQERFANHSLNEIVAGQLLLPTAALLSFSIDSPDGDM
jgi:hypothetical protein